MQTAGPELIDFSKESPQTLEMYGVNKETMRQFATNCLLARRMVERGVRFVMLMHASWDQHTYLNRDLKKNCDITDPADGGADEGFEAARAARLHAGRLGRGIRPHADGGDSRTPSNPENAGRDHHPIAYSMWLAGGGIKGGQVIGKTDDLGFNIVEDKVHVHDLQATILQSPGIRSHAADLSLHGPRLPPDGRGRQGRREDADLIR